MGKKDTKGLKEWSSQGIIEKEALDKFELEVDDALARRINELQKQEANIGINDIESQELSNNKSVLDKRKKSREYDNVVSSSQEIRTCAAEFSLKGDMTQGENIGLQVDVPNGATPIKVGDRDIVSEIDELKKVKNGDLLETKQMNDIISAINILSEKVDKKPNKSDSNYGAMLKSVKNICPTCGAELKIREMDTHKLLECEFCSKESIVVFGAD